MKKHTKPADLPDAATDEAAAPDAKDLARVDAMVASDPVLKALWEAKDFDENQNDKQKTKAP